MSKISISIQYAGLTLPVSKNDQGQDITPLKPISDLFGFRWQKQRQKVTESAFLIKHLGVSGIPRGISDGSLGEDNLTSNPTYKDEIFIKLDRVVAYLMTINPDQVRAQGNISGADFLEEKITEWADALHDFEEIGIAINSNHAKTQDAIRKQRASFAQMIGIKNKTAELQDRKALSHIVNQMADELSIPYQIDLADSQ
jgi:hypothetical protein